MKQCSSLSPTSLTLASLNGPDSLPNWGLLLSITLQDVTNHMNDQHKFQSVNHGRTLKRNEWQ